tara:strand:- start:37603 stop:37935 length:333 start_codon:yes stop_codon:yes gene_type:complete
MMAVKCLKAGQNGRLLDKDSRCVAFNPDDGGKKMARMCKGTARPVSKWELTTSVVRVLVVPPSDVLGDGFPAAAKSGHKSTLWRYVCRRAAASRMHSQDFSSAFEPATVA